MTRTVVCHFFNEQYLLPWWLDHHKQIFDHGIMIDYASTDASCDIIRQKCPSWEIRPSRNEFFTYHEIDREVMDIEAGLQGWRMCLNVTEFLLGDMTAMCRPERNTVKMPALCMVDMEWGREFDGTQPLVGQCTTGLDFRDHFSMRWGRSMQNHPIIYPQGRHWFEYNTTDLVTLWMGWSPWNEQGIQRKLQIKDRLGAWDLQAPVALQHKLDRDLMFNHHAVWWKPRAVDLTQELARLSTLHQASLDRFKSMAL